MCYNGIIIIIIIIIIISYINIITVRVTLQTPVAIFPCLSGLILLTIQLIFFHYHRLALYQHVILLCYQSNTFYYMSGYFLAKLQKFSCNLAYSLTICDLPMIAVEIFSSQASICLSLSASCLMPVGSYKHRVFYIYSSVFSRIFRELS